MSIKVSPGETVGAKVLWRNNGTVVISPSFSYGVRQATTDWYEGIAVKSVSVSPGQEGEIDVTCPLPADWEIGLVAARVTAEGIPEVLWEGSNIYQIGEEVPPIPEPPDILSEMMPLIIMVMLVSMMQPMMGGGGGEATGGEGVK